MTRPSDDAATVTPASVETSVLVRYFVQDDAVMGPAATRLLDGAGEIVISGIALAVSGGADLVRAHDVRAAGRGVRGVA